MTRASEFASEAAGESASESANQPAGEPASVASGLVAEVAQSIAQAGGWLPFDRFMALALYAPQGGYYANASPKFGAMPASGSDFITAPEMSPWFGRALARQVAQALQACAGDTLIEFGAGSGALAEQLLDALGASIKRYLIVDLSGSLRARQEQRLARFAPRVQWLEALPEALHGVVIANEVLDAMPVQLLHFDGQQWLERGVVMAGDATAATAATAARAAGGTSSQATRGNAAACGLAWGDVLTTLRPPLHNALPAGTCTELHAQALAWTCTLAQRLQRGVVILIDYGFPEHEYYHPQRSGGTLMCHRAHRADADPLVDVGLKDITAHVNFSAIALAAQDAGCEVIGYTSQARFLINCGLVQMLESAGLAERAMAQKLLNEHEMGELFKVLAFVRGCEFEPLGFAAGDRSHRL